MTDEIKPLQLGQILPNGGQVLEFKWRDSTKGELPGKHGIVLCFLPENPYHPYVVWSFVFTYEQHPINPLLETIYGIHCMYGDYHTNLKDAVYIYEKREV